MGHRKKILRNLRSPLAIGVLLVSGRAALGQDGEVVAWDPRETGELTLSWQTVLIGLALALACCGLWRLFIWFLESRRPVVWTRARIWWPTAMVVWGWVVLVMFSKSESWGWGFDAILAIYAVVNFPALIVVAAVLESSGHLAAWQRVAIGSPVMWVCCYLLVRLAEWRAYINVPTVLNMAGKPR
jgi:hypothetical protein